MDIRYRSNVCRRKRAFWKRTGACLIYVFVILGCARTNVADKSVDNSSSTQFPNATENFTNENDDNSKRTKWKSVQDSINLGLLKNLTHYLNETQKHIDSVYSDVEKVKNDIKSVEEILEVNLDESVKHDEKHFQRNANNAEEVDLFNDTDRLAQRLGASNSAADPPQSSKSLIAPDENIERRTENISNLSQNLVVSTDQPFTLSLPAEELESVNSKTVHYPDELPAKTTISSATIFTFEDSTNVSELEHTTDAETPVTKKDNSANKTEDENERSLLVKTTTLQPYESVTTPVSVTESVLSSSKIFDDATNISYFKPTDRSWPSTTYEDFTRPSSSTSKNFSIFTEQVSLSTTTAASPVSSSETIPDIVSQKPGQNTENEIPEVDLEYIMRYLSYVASDKGLEENTNQNSVDQTQKTQNGSQLTTHVQKRICFKDIDSTGDLFVADDSSKPVDMYVYYQSYAPNEQNFESSSHVKHRYTKVQSVDNDDLYGAYSLHNHKVVSRYMFKEGKTNNRENVPPDHNRRDTLSNGTDYESPADKFFNSIDDESESDIFCISVPVPVPVPVTHVEQKSSSANDDIVVLSDDLRRQKFYYKKLMPFNLDTFITNSMQVCDRMCFDSKVCLKPNQICDDIVHCKDLSDEQNCSCRDRMDAKKICDGYYDCPNGKDEEQCDEDCPADYFTCSRASQKYRRPNCIPMSQRCDNVPDCADRSDEMNCEILTETVDSHEHFTTSYTNGYLHRNWHGKWYPVCDIDDTSYDWAVKACAAETGNRKMHVDVELLPYVNEYKGHFISKTGSVGRFVLLENCGVRNRAVHVKCPPMSCGSRMMPLEYFESGYRSRRHLERVDPREVMQTLENIEHNLNYIRLHLWNGSDDTGFRYRNIEQGLNFLNAHSRNVSQDSEKGMDGRVIQGRVSVPGKWPWVVAIFRNGNFHCGGTILDENWIMTAAHCLNRYEQHYYEVRAGVLRRLSFSPDEQIRSVSQIILHPNYVNSDMQNDLALIRLESPLNYNRWIRPICLPEARPPWGPTPGTLCVAMGWGSTTEKGMNPDNLREVELPILPDCKHLPDKQADEICAGYLKGGRDTCQGDSGGPLLCRIPGTHDRWYVAGVISHGEGCARPMEPGAYTRVALYIPWLMQNTDYTFLRTSRNPKKDCPGMRCEIGGRCTPVKRICDGVIDCLNAEDERGCLPFEESSNTSDDGDDCDKENFYKTLSLHGYKRAQKCGRNLFYGYGSNFTRSSNESEYATPISYDKMTQFLCQKIVQVIPQGWRCDGDADCEDATDEMNCTCADFLRAENKSLICDGIIHCHDESDERYCLDQPCHNTQFYCYKSRSCINDRMSRCNGSHECPEGEDEDNCYAIFPSSEKGSLMKLDYFEVPAFAERGIIAKNERGTWKPFCVGSENENEVTYSRIVYKHLRKLGFKEASAFHRNIMVINGDLQRPNFDINYCQGVSVDLRYAVHKEDYTSLPWHADIYINGEQRCIGLLVHDQWIVADFACCREFNATEDTVVAVVGGEAKSKIRSPHQQMILSDGTKCRSDLGIMVVHLRQTPNVTLHTRILRVPYWLIPQNSATDVCYLIFNHENSKDSVRVKSYTSCPSNKRCYSVDDKVQLCKKSTNGSLLLEGVVCIEKNQWYLSTTVIGWNEYFCTSENDILELDYLENPKDIFTRRNESRPDSFSHSRDFLCDLGNRIPWSRVCDGKPDCHYGEDEDATRCSLKDDICRSNKSRNDCDCKMGQLKCANGRCISNAFICDGERDCEDGSDEPEQCSVSGGFTCAVYLNLTDPSKLCDMRQDCHDRSDETNTACWSKYDPLLSFNCSRSNRCVPMDFVCDGEQDCPDKEDEEDCFQLRSADETDKSGNVTVWIQSGGKWQELCVRTDEYTALEEDLLCQRSNFSKALKVREVPRRRSVRDDIFTTVRLNNMEEIRIKNLRRKNADLDSTEECSNWNLLCEIKKAE